MNEVEKIIAWSVIFGQKYTFMTKDKKPKYSLINKILKQYGYMAVQKVFVIFLLENRVFDSEKELLSALFGELGDLSKRFER